MTSGSGVRSTRPTHPDLPDPPDLMTPKRSSESATEMVQVVLPNDANPLGFILGGAGWRLIDSAGAIGCHRHTRSLLVTAEVDDLQDLNSINVGDLITL